MDYNFRGVRTNLPESARNRRRPLLLVKTIRFSLVFLAVFFENLTTVIQSLPPNRYANIFKKP